MLNHPPQPSIIVCVCVFADIRHGVCEVVRKERGCATTLITLTLHNCTWTHTVFIRACLNISMRLHMSTNRNANKHLEQSTWKAISLNQCDSYTSLVLTTISNPCETVDYACKFSCLQTDGFCCVSFYLLQLNVNHYLVYSSLQRNTAVLYQPEL